MSGAQTPNVAVRFDSVKDPFVIRNMYTSAEQ